MNKSKVTKITERVKLGVYDIEEYDYVIGIEWSLDNCTLAIIGRRKIEPVIRVMKPEILEVKQFFRDLRGKKIATIEETTTSQWLYVELKDVLDRIVICDPYKNKLLSDGPKTDKIDAKKLSILLKGHNITEVYHTIEARYKLRKLVSGYEDIIKAGVRLKNQHLALLRSEGKIKGEDLGKDKVIRFISTCQERGISLYDEIREQYRERFREEIKKDKKLRSLKSIPGIGEIGAVQILSVVLQAERFKSAGKYLAYSGLVKHIKESGNRNYGKRKPRYSRILKSVYKTACIAAIGGNNAIHEYYDYLREKGLDEDKAKSAVCRYICRISLGIMKSDEKYEPYRWRDHK
jgi:transposase